jgi:hypothetical protein
MNSRSSFMLGFTSIALSFTLGLMLGIIKTRLFTIRNLILAGIVVWIFTGPMADLGKAMVVVRSQRSEISRLDLVTETFRVFTNKEALGKFTDPETWNSGDWDETYLNNIFLARFSNLKFNDLSLIQATKIDSHSSSVYYYSIARIWATFPAPVLNTFDIEVDKSLVNGSSFGDYLYFKAGAGEQVLGGMLTGHFAGTGMAAFGWWYLLILGIGMIPIFLLFDVFFMKNDSGFSSSGTKHQTRLYFSLCGLMNLTPVFMFLPAESVITIATFLIRGWIQIIFLYWVLYQITRRLNSLFRR